MSYEEAALSMQNYLSEIRSLSRKNPKEAEAKVMVIIEGTGLLTKQKKFKKKICTR